MNKQVKIALCGANSVGKSTLATELHKIISPGFELITWSRPTAAAIKLGYESARDIPNDDQSQWQFQVEALLQQILAQNNQKGSYIIDRSPLDFLAFLYVRLPHIKFTQQAELYERIAVEFTKFDYFFFVPNFGLPPEDNGVRLLSPPDPVEAELKRLFDKYKIEHYTLKNKTLKTRLDEVMRKLGNI